MTAQVVPFDGSEASYRDRVALLKEAQPDEPWSVEGEQTADSADIAAGRPGGAFFAEVGSERVGFARFRANPDDPPARRHRLWLVVARRARRRGLGSMLLREVAEAAAARGATEFLVSTSLAEPDGFAFALHHGFSEVEVEVELHLDLGCFKACGHRAGSPVPGLHISNPASLARDDPGWWKRYHGLYTALAAGVMWGPDAAPPEPEVFRRWHLGAPEFLAEGTVVAAAGGEWVGLCELWRSGDDRGTAYQELTGVLPTCRCRGVGTALLAAAADGAARLGYRRLLTSTGTENEAMQRLARRLGFTAVARWSYLVGPVPGRRVLSAEEVEP